MKHGTATTCRVQPGDVARLLFVAALFLFAFSAWSQPSTYQPRYWVEGTTDYSRNVDPSAIDKMVGDVYAKGWRGVLYWGASRNGDKMNYYYNSPFLRQQSWANFERDGLTPLVQSAHKNSLKVMVNIEGVNPYCYNLRRTQAVPLLHNTNSKLCSLCV